MNIAAVSHRTTTEFCYAVDADTVVVNIKTGKDVQRAFIISEDLKLYYYRGLSEWSREKGYLRDTCLTAQDRFKEYLKYFRIEFEK